MNVECLECKEIWDQDFDPVACTCGDSIDWRLLESDWDDGE